MTDWGAVTKCVDTVAAAAAATKVFFAVPQLFELLAQSKPRLALGVQHE